MTRLCLRRIFYPVGAGVSLVLVTATAAAADLPGAGIVKDAIGGASGFAFDSIADGIGGWVLGAVGYFVNGVLDFLRTSARPDVGAAWFAGPGSPYATVRDIAGVLLVGFVLLGLIQGLLHGDIMGMVRRVAGTLPLAIGGMIVTTAVAGQFLALTDALSETVLHGTGERAVQFLSGFGLAASGATQGFAAVVLGFVAVLAALVLWVELIVRASLVYLLVAISPIGFAALLWPAARGFLRKTLEILLAVIVSKFVICVALAIGVAALAGAGDAGQLAGAGAAAAGAAGAGLSSPMATRLSALLVGAVILGLAAFSPFLVLKLIPLAEGAVVAQGLSRGPVRAAQSGVSTYSTARSLGRIGGGAGGRQPAPSALGAPPGGPTAAASRSGSPAAPATGGVAAAVAAGAGAAATAVRVPTEAVRRSAAELASDGGPSSNGSRVAPTNPPAPNPYSNGNRKERA